MYRLLLVIIVSLFCAQPNLQAELAYSFDYASTLWADADKDGIYDDKDNCPNTFNPHQDDSDRDGIGDVCDDDDCACENEFQMIYVCQQGITRRVYCSALSDPDTFCGPCQDQEQQEEKEQVCAECPVDDRGNIRLCVIRTNKLINLQGRCDDLTDYFDNDGDLVDGVECGPCTCAMINDVDTDGDGACDSIDECPNNPLKTEAGMCGCDAYDSDGDWVCDADDICPGGSDKIDTDGDGVPDFCDVCEGHDDNIDRDGDGTPDGCDICPNSAGDDSDGDGVCDDLDICPGGDDNIDNNGDGIPDACETSKCAVSGNSEFEWIQDVKINDWFNLTNDNGGYAEFTDPSLMFFPGDSIELWVTPGFIDQVAELSYAIFVDWNGDGDFDDQEERVYDTRSLRERGIDMVVPPFAQPGNICARFIVNYGRITSACDPCIDGEVEDYILLIKDGGTSPDPEVDPDGDCDQTEESFNYELDRSLQGLNDGWGWTSAWRAAVNGNPSAQILQQSLSASNIATVGQKLGVLTPTGTSYMMARDFALQSQDMWLSFTYMKRGAAGMLELRLGDNDETVMIDQSGALNLAGNVGPSLPSNGPSLVVLHIQRSGSQDQISAWINPTQSMVLTAGNAAIQTAASLDRDISSVLFSFAGVDPVGTTEHYIDEIRLACTQDRILSDQGGNNPDPVDMEITIAPNPITNGANAGITLSNATFLQGTLNLYTMAGAMVLTQDAVAGLNIVPTAGLQGGIYILEIDTDAGRVMAQLVVQI